LALGALSSVLGFHLRLASAAVYRDFAVSMGGLDLTQKQFAVLELIAANSGVSQIDIAKALGTDRATMMALVDRLEVRALLEKRRSKSDRRRQILSLTIAGQALLSEARNVVAGHERRLMAGFSDTELARLVASLRRLCDRASAAETAEV
jgi:DNA-binding MarR family transcriptional regulator